MKGPSLLAVALTAITLSLSAQGTRDIEAIKAVIMQETSSFLGVDRKAWASTWLQAPYVYWSYADSTGESFVEGWENLNKTFDQYFKTQRPSSAKITNEWIEFRVYGNGAYVRFYQTLKDNIDRDQTSQVRVLEKKSNRWKIIYVGAVAKYPEKGYDRH